MNTRLHRRDFIRTASLFPIGLAAGATSGALTASAAAQQAPASAPAAKRPLKISLNAYCFNKALLPPTGGGKPEMSLFDVLEFCARYNFDAIDPTGYYFPGYPAVPSDSFINDFKRRAFKLGIDISGTGVRNNFAQADKQLRAADVQLVKNWIEAAAKLGAPVIRVFAGAEPADTPRQQIAEWMVADLKECVEHGKRFGVVVGIQNHGDFLKTADQVLEIVKMVDSEWFGVIVDTGNFQTGDSYEQMARVMPHAVNLQIKTSPFGKDSPVRTDLPKLIRIIRESGYRGYLPIETLVPTGKEVNPMVEVPRFLQEVRAAIEA